MLYSAASPGREAHQETSDTEYNIVIAVSAARYGDRQSTTSELLCNC